MTRKSEVASSVPFDNATNGLSSTNTQEAIEEVAMPIAALQHAKAIVVGSTVIYATYDPLISMDGSGLKRETV